MKKIVIYLSGAAVILLAAIFFSGLYPVARVEGKLITFRAFAKSARAAESFANAEFQKSGMEPVDFFSSQNASLRRDIARGTLTFLIEDKILEKEGKGLAQDFALRVRLRTDEAIKKGSNMEAAARLVYGLRFKDFRVLVLEPQARRDVAAEIVKGQNNDFFIWFAEKKKNADMRLYFSGYRWTGEKVE
ncbi:MAG: hypothetical protein HYT37_01515 [Candidatus Sungbacteria bacterium]|nr:hypothetical protein [Candidatus Sungbacteria bacterium]